jgi:hypothetical protein
MLAGGCHAALKMATIPGDKSPVARQVDWEAWERAKTRYDTAHEAVLRFLRGPKDAQ